MFFLCVSGASAYEHEITYDYWRMDFAKPSRDYIWNMFERHDLGDSWLHFRRMDRFEHIDHAFGMGWSQTQKGWQWEFLGAFTPEAAVLPRHRESLLLYLPPFFAGSMPYTSVQFERFNEARKWGGALGMKQQLAGGLIGEARITRARTQLTDSVLPKRWANSIHYELAYRLGSISRLFVWEDRNKEYFDPGNPVFPGAYESTEKGIGLLFKRGNFPAIRLGYAREERGYGNVTKLTAVLIQK